MTSFKKVVLGIALSALVSAAHEAQAGDKYLGVELVLVPWGQIETGLAGDSEDMSPSVGFGVSLEWAVVKCLSLGGMMQFRFLRSDDYNGTFQELQLDPMVRLFFPGKILEPFAKFRIGGSFLWPPDRDASTMEFGAGWNWAAYGGLVIRIGKLGLFAELGYGQAYAPSRVVGPLVDKDIDIAMKTVETNLGAMIIF